ANRVRIRTMICRLRPFARVRACKALRGKCAVHAGRSGGDRAPSPRHAGTATLGRGVSMKRLYMGAVATIGMVFALGSGTALSEGRTDVILAGSQGQIDYHAEAAAARPDAGGATII